MRVEWAKSKARAERWREELALLTEEMRRSLAYVRAEAGSWRKLAEQQHELVQRSRGPTADALEDGRRAYAVQKALMYEGLARRFAAKWAPVVLMAKNSPLGEHVIALGEECQLPASTGAGVVIEVRDEDESPTDNAAGYNEPDEGPMDEVGGVDAYTYH